MSDEVEKLIRQLQSEDWGERKRGAKALVELGEIAVKPLLLELADHRVRGRAAKILGNLGEGELARAVVAVLKGKAGAVEALVQLEDARGVGPLLRALRDTDGRVWARAAQALEKLGEGGLAQAMAAFWKGEDGATETLAQLKDDRAVELLTRVLDDDGQVRTRAVEALGKIGDDRAVELLIQILESKDRRSQNYVRARAAQALGCIGNPRAVMPLIQALRDTDGRVQVLAAEALEKLGEGGLAQAVVAVWRGEDRAIEVLVQLGDDRAMESLFQALRDENGSGQVQTVEALGKIGDDRAVEPLIEILAGKDWRSRGCREQAAEALGKIGNPRAVEPLIQTLGDRDWSVQKRAMEALEKLGEERLAQAVVAVLRGENRAIETLVRLRDARAVEPLIRALGDEDEGVWKRAKETLVKLGGPAIEALLRALKEWNVEERAAEALGKMGEPAVEPLIRALGDENSNVRARAAWALGQLRDGQALPSLRARARRIGGDANPEVRTACRKAIAQIKAATGRKEVVPAPAPVGTGKEVTPASAPAGRGTEVRPAEEKAEEQG